MSSHNRQAGFTLIEMLVALVLTGIVVIVMYASFNAFISQYFVMQKSGTQFSEMAASSQRLANVLRGTTDFLAVGDNDVTVYAYFYPKNAYVSQVRYYLNTQNNALLADVTPMTGNPPAGTPITANKKTYTIISNYYKAPGVNLFTYLDAAGNALPLPVSDQHIIKGVKLVLATPGPDTAPNTPQTMSLNISLRNRKTNL